MDKKVKLFYRRWKDPKDATWKTILFTGFGKFRCSKCKKEKVATAQGFNCFLGKEHLGLSGCCGVRLTPLAYHPSVGEIEFIRIKTYEEFILLKDKQSKEFIDFEPEYIKEFESRTEEVVSELEQQEEVIQTPKSFEIVIEEPEENDDENGVTLKEIYGD